MINKYFKCFIVCIINCSLVNAQNLVENSSFEVYSECPSQEDQLKFVKGWDNPSKSSPDYYNSCNGDSISSKTIVGIPNNFNGYKTAHVGNGYVGIVLCSSDPQFREYIQTKFKEKLSFGKQYKLSFWISIADSSHYKSNGLSVCFSQNKNLSTGDVKDGGIILSYNNGQAVWYKLNKCQAKEWIQINGIYTANGTEEYLTIGVFKEDNKKLKIKRIKKASKFHMSYAYYFFDDIEITPL